MRKRRQRRVAKRRQPLPLIEPAVEPDAAEGFGLRVALGKVPFEPPAFARVAKAEVDGADGADGALGEDDD